MLGRVTHLKKIGQERAVCGEVGPYLFLTFDGHKVTCTRCRKRGKHRIEAPKPVPKTIGRVVQPGGGRRR